MHVYGARWQRDDRRRDEQLGDCSESRNFMFPHLRVAHGPPSPQICLPLFQKVKHRARTSPAKGRGGVEEDSEEFCSFPSRAETGQLPSHPSQNQGQELVCLIDQLSPQLPRLGPGVPDRVSTGHKRGIWGRVTSHVCPTLASKCPYLWALFKAHTQCGPDRHHPEPP